MKVLAVILSLFVFFKTLYYGIYEIKQNNKIPGISIIVLSVICLILPNIMVFFRLNLSS